MSCPKQPKHVPNPPFLPPPPPFYYVCRKSIPGLIPGLIVTLTCDASRPALLDYSLTAAVLCECIRTGRRHVLYHHPPGRDAN